MKKIIIDLGHGASDPGAVGNGGTKEANVVLSIGKEIEKVLKEYNIDFKFTRISNDYISLEERVKIANSFNADYFVSIHMNSTSDTNVRGAEVWQYDNKDENLNEFSLKVCNEISTNLQIKNRGVKFNKEFYVLKNTKMPACLIEVDFISNKDAEEYVNKSNNIKFIADKITSNILRLLEVGSKDETLYKVCIGAYHDKSNAIRQMDLAKNNGFKDTYII